MHLHNTALYSLVLQNRATRTRDSAASDDDAKVNLMYASEALCVSAPCYVTGSLAG